jgi:hypothetical protein
MGETATTNRGISLASGDLVFCGAADDVYYPGLFDVGAAMLAAYPSAALFSASSDIIDINGGNKGRFMSPKPLKQPGFLDPRAALTEMLRDDGWFMGNTALYRRTALLAAGGFDEQLGAFSDGYMCRLLALQRGACYTPEILAAWRWMEGGLAWAQAMKTDTAADFVEFVERRMAETGGVFPALYIHRWQRRYLFSVRRFALLHDKSVPRGWPGALRRCSNTVKILWMFLMLRPWDLGTVSRRWIRKLWDEEISPRKG